MAMILYTVQPGDSLWSIAQRHNTSVDELVRTNGLTSPNELFPGQTLRVFVAEPTAPRWYVVQAGDSLFKIANYFGTTIDRLVRDNPMADPNLIYPGQILIIK